MKSVTKATRKISSFCETIPNTALSDPWCHNEQTLRPVGHTYQRISFKNTFSGTVSSSNKKKIEKKNRFEVKVFKRVSGEATKTFKT